MTDTFATAAEITDTGVRVSYAGPTDEELEAMTLGGGLGPLGVNMARTADLDADIDENDPEAFEKELAAIAEEEAARKQEASQRELSFDEQVEQVLACVFFHPSFREIKRNILVKCAEPQKQAALEAWIAVQPEFQADMQSPIRVIESLIEAGGLMSVPYLKSGEATTEEALDAMTDEEFYEQFDDCSITATEAGTEAACRTAPKARVDELRHAHPVQDPGYVEVLRYIAEEPRTRYQIEKFCAGKPYLKTMSNLGVAEVRPSHFIDKLERAGVITWRDAWTINDAGRAYLASLDAQAQEAEAQATAVQSTGSAI